MENQIHPSGFVVQPRLKFEKTIDKMLYLYFYNIANYEDEHNCKKGQLIISVLNLSDEIGCSRGAIRGAIKRLEKKGYILSEVRKQNKGLLITIVNYDELQKLGNYGNKINQRNEQQKSQQTNQRKNQRNENETPCESKEEGLLKNEANQRNEQQKSQQTNQRKNQAITTYINSIINNNININNKNLTSIIDEANIKNVNLSSREEIEIYVDFALQINALPSGISRKILISYFDCIRLTRQTCTISAKILAKFIEKIQKYSVNQIHYALWMHVEKHDDKREQYTLGILRNTDEHEARRGLMILKNKGGAKDLAVGQGDPQYDYGF